LIAAGGLTPATVGDVVRRLRPWAVDVSSGVESSRGVKSIDKMTAFVAAVREADRIT
jgi:phosphoribosylanthranilate isomerase